jgi:hypothetical protein
MSTAGKKAFTVTALAVAVLGLGATEAQAGGARYGTISWEALDPRAPECHHVPREDGPAADMDLSSSSASGTLAAAVTGTGPSYTVSVMDGGETA